MLSPYLSNGYAPIRREFELAAVPHGDWPADLRGTFYRIGPNPQFEPRGHYNPLQADGMVHAFTIDEGAVSYRNRWVRTQQWQLEHAAGRALFATSGDPAEADPSVVGRSTNGVANTNLVWHGGRLLALEEGHGPIELDPVTLETRGGWDFAGRLPRNMTAHPKRDPVNGELWFIANFESGRINADVGVHKVDADGQLVRSMVVTGPMPSLLHDFALTSDFVLLFYCPVTASMRRARAGGPLLAFEPELGMQLGVLPRAGAAADVRWFQGPTCMVWHVLNAWNDGSRICIDLCQQNAPMFPRADGTAPLHGQAHQLLTRWTLDCSGGGALDCETLCAEVCEYPRIDERCSGREHRHAYVACLGGPGTDDLFQRGIAHIDLHTRTVNRYSAGPHTAVAEPVFVARPGSIEEGDGYLLTNIYDEASNASHLALFDAATPQAGPRAIAQLEHRVPIGFHGLWKAAAP